MDLDANFVAATRQAPYPPPGGAAIVHNRLQVSKHLNEAVDPTRRQESVRVTVQR